MGFFSWKTQDTDESIANSYSNRDTFRVQMIDNAGNVFTEDNYEGYGVFGGKDFYELLAEMNGFKSNRFEIGTDEYTDEARGFGITLAFSKENHSGVGTEGVYYPNLIEQADGWVYEMAGPDSCDNQGYFYNDVDYEDEDEYSDEEDNFDYNF
jgi:hypothetical protein